MGKGEAGRRSLQRKQMPDEHVELEQCLQTSLQGISKKAVKLCAKGVGLKSLVRENRTQGSVRGVSGNGCFYLDDIMNKMIPAGYMYKKVLPNSNDWLKKDGIVDIYSVSDCMSEDFTDWLEFWKHNNHWFFDSPAIIQTLAKSYNVSLNGMTLFYYTVHEMQWNDLTKIWETYAFDNSSKTDVLIPEQLTLEGYDIVNSSTGNTAECSPLSCNQLAQDVDVNKHCLLDSFNSAVNLLETGRLSDCEPGPYRVYAVHTTNTM